MKTLSKTTAWYKRQFLLGLAFHIRAETEMRYQGQKVPMYPLRGGHPVCYRKRLHNASTRPPRDSSWQPLLFDQITRTIYNTLVSTNQTHPLDLQSLLQNLQVND
jgi:hypothetical protein